MFKHNTIHTLNKYCVSPVRPSKKLSQRTSYRYFTQENSVRERKERTQSNIVKRFYENII